MTPEQRREWRRLCEGQHRHGYAAPILELLDDLDASEQHSRRWHALARRLWRRADFFLHEEIAAALRRAEQAERERDEARAERDRALGERDNFEDCAKQLDVARAALRDALDHLSGEDYERARAALGER